MSHGSLDAHDQLSGYCRMLGHYLHFAYCRSCIDDKPCTAILDCWFERFDVQRFISRHYPEVLRAQEQQPRAKLTTLVELIEQARQRGGQS